VKLSQIPPFRSTEMTPGRTRQARIRLRIAPPAAWPHGRAARGIAFRRRARPRPNPPVPEGTPADAVTYGAFMGAAVDFVVISFVVFILTSSLLWPAPAPV